MKKRLISLILFLSLVLSVVMPVSYAEEDVQPEGIAISTIEQLNMIGYEYPLDGSYYLTNDIDMSTATSKNGDYYNEGLGWEPIGSRSTPFTGTFDGNGFSIIGMNINRPDAYYVGLFAYIEGGIVKNLTLRNCNVSAGLWYSQSNGTVSSDVGAFAGYVESGIITCCVNEGGTVSGYTAGGIVGGSRAEISNCINSATVLGSSDSGGIAGFANNSIKSCVNKGTITSSTEASSAGTVAAAGGICGSSCGTISQCTNYGDFINCKIDSAGICGRMAYGKIVACSNYGDGANSGIVIISRNSNFSLTVSKCMNRGQCEVGIGKGWGNFDNCFTTYGRYAFEPEYSGGYYSYGTYSNCYNTGGRIAGGGTTSNCYYVADSASSTGELRNARQMTIQSTFENWDFDTVWTMNGNEEYLFPELQCISIEYTKSLVGIAMAVEPVKQSYLEGKEQLDLTGAKLTLKYDNTTTEKIDITEDMVSGFDNTKVGTQTIKVSYGGFETSFNVIILAKSLSAITVTTLPEKLIYLEGKDTLDVTGGIITRYYNNDTFDTLALSVSMVTGFDNTVIGPQELTVTVGTAKATYEIEVIAKTMTGISVTKLPTKTSYLEGKDSLNLTGGRITLYYDNDSTQEIPLSEATVTGFNNKKVGKQTLTVWYNGFSATFEVEIIAKSVRNIVVSTLPNTLTYLEGKDVLDVTDGKITVFYDNDTQEIIDLKIDMVSGFDNTLVGLQVLTVTYEGKTAVYEIEVVAKKLLSIEVTTLPAKLTYRENKDQLSVTGGRITLYYNNGTTCEIELTADMVSGFDNTRIGTQILLVTYEGKTATFEIEIIEKRLAAISVTALPAKLNYLEGMDLLDVTGGKVTLYFDNDSEETINMTEEMISGFDNSKPGIQTLTVHYGGKTTSFTVEIIAKQLLSIELAALPEKLVYAEGETLDVTGGKLMLRYNNGTTEAVDLEEWMVSGYDAWMLGEQKLTVAYGCYTTSYSVEVIHVHSYSAVITEPSCTETGYTTYTCDTCGHSYIADRVDATGHGYSIVITEPTCTENGEKVYTCLQCGHSYSENIAALGHSYISNTIEPTCTEDGYTTYTCDACGHGYTTDIVEAFGHSYYKGKCTACGEKDPNWTAPFVNPFVDVKESDYYYTPVLWAVEKGITNGTSPTEFSPEDPCTRGQIVTFLWRSFGSPEPTKTDNPFVDVSSNMYYYKAVLWAVEQGITTGVSKTEFEPDATCTRGQVATFLWRACGKPAPESNSNPFSDVDSNMYYYQPILWAVEQGVTNGTGGGKFSPEESCTRGQIVTFLYRALAE